ncbi:MAG: PKD domain-containing protein [Bacteroidota bacterium]
MKKIILLSLVAVLLLTQVNAQTISCNANFSWNMSGTTVKFIPDLPLDTTGIYSEWHFGYGNNWTSFTSPYHTYPATGGSYEVTHIVVRYNPNHVEVCRDSVTKIIVIQADCVVPNFTYHATVDSYLKIKFTNTSLNYNSTDSIVWMFGDGTTSNDISPTHTYTSSGIYRVCLLIKKRNTPNICIKEKCFDVIVARPCDLQANFSWQKDPVVNNKFYFVNTSTGASATDSVYWSFGDGTHSTNTNPDHIYPAIGTYTVCLKVKRFPYTPGTVECVQTECKTLQITTGDCNILPAYTWRTDSTNKKKIIFKNTTEWVTTNANIIPTWSFGDGSANVSTWDATHEYTQPGKYYVCLKLQYGTTTCIKYKCDSVTVPDNTIPCVLTAGFTLKADSTNKKKIIFTATSNLPSGTAADIHWNFGDGSALASGWNVTHEYAQAGKYYVCIKVQTSNTCFKYVCDSITVVANPIPCVLTAGFTLKADSLNKKKIIFAATSNLPTGTAADVHWNFGDDSALASGWNVTHEYAQPGRYSVCLKVQTSNTCFKYVCDSITVTDNPPTCDFVASYTWRSDSLNKKKIYFTNTTTVPTPNAVATWTFGDGTQTHTWSPVHEYAQAGKYYVCLKVQYGTSTSCIKYKCDSVTVTVPPVSNCENFSLFTYSGIASTRQYSFAPVYQNHDVQYTWTFGDGTGNHDMITTHQFANSNAYQVCLTAFKNNNCAFTTCKEVRVAPITNCDSIKVAYQYTKDQYMPNKIHFYSYSSTAVQQQTWTIYKDGTTGTPITITQNNPVYTFTDTGHYYVCLKITTTNGCVKEYCSIVNVERIADLCELQAYPNPVNSQVSINVEQSTNETIHAYIYNSLNILMGEKHQAGYTGANIVSMYTANLPAGFYTIKIIYGNKICFARFQKI